jgi:hypothetical protein
VNEAGGISVAVGVDRATRARYFLPDVPAVHAWLARSLESIRGPEAP